jgi:multidrug efflux pump
MAWPIIASTCTTLAAFVPLALWPGIMGEFMKYLPITLIAVLSSSLIMALVFVPTLGSLFGKPGAISEKARKNLADAETGDLDDVTGFTGHYVQFLKRSLRRPWRSVAGVFGLLIAVYIAFFALGRGVEYIPDVEMPFAMVDIRARGDLSIDEQDTLVRQVENRVLGMPEIENLYTKTGSSSRGSEDLIGSLTLNYIDWDRRRRSDAILADIRANTDWQADSHRDCIALPGPSRAGRREYPCHDGGPSRGYEYRGRQTAARHRVANQGRPCRGCSLWRRHIARRCDGSTRDQRHQDW